MHLTPRTLAMALAACVAGGLVLGMVFGAGLQDDPTGYAITGPQLSDTVTNGIRRTEPVDTGSCEIRE